MRRTPGYRWAAIWPSARVLAGGLLLVTAVGCRGPFKVTFVVDDIINVPRDVNDDSKDQKLDVDIVCLNKSDEKARPGIGSGTVKAQEWFDMREKNKQPTSSDRIFALCANSNPPNAKKLGDALVSGRYMSGKKEVSYDITHPGGGGERIAIFARYWHDRNGTVENTDPVIFDPNAGWKKKEGKVHVTKQSLVRTP